MELKGKTAIVTGGGTGIGRGVALRLADSGANLVVCGRRSSPLEIVVEAIEAGGSKAVAVQADVSNVTDVARLVEHALETFGDIHILVNNAGISGGGPIHVHSVESWDRIMAVNLRGPFLLSRAVLPHMRHVKRGHIINISSESALEHYPGNGAYGVAKHALNALGEYIQRENQKHGIRVDTICPGMVVTEMTEGAPNLDETRCLYPEEGIL